MLKRENDTTTEKPEMARVINGTPVLRVQCTSHLTLTDQNMCGHNTLIKLALGDSNGFHTDIRIWIHFIIYTEFQN